MKALNQKMFFLKKRTIVSCFLSLIIIFYYLLNFKNFILWGQIIESYTLTSIFSIQSHSLRNILINGLIFIVQSIVDTDRITAFNIITHFILFLSTIIFSHVVYEKVSKNILVATVLSFSVVILSFFQNGRGVFGCFSILILYYTLLVENNYLKWFFVFLSIFFSNVSSGIFSVLTICIVLGSLNNTLNFIKLKQLILLMIPLTPIFILYFNKNFKFYDYDFLKLLSHGLGIIFQTSQAILIPTTLSLLVVLFASFLYVFRLNRNIVNSIYFPFVLSSIIGIFFGYSSFTCFSYIFLIILFKNIKRLNHFNKPPKLESLI